MLGLSHALLHVGFCSAIARAKPETTIAMHLRLSYRQGPQLGTQLDKTYSFTRSDGSETVIEFDVPRGLYRLSLDVPAYKCSGSDFLEFLPDGNRTITETLSDGATPPAPVELLYGTAPLSFVYAKPTFVIFDKSVTCNQPVSTPIATHIVSEHDRDAYYTWLYSDPTLAARGPAVVALRLSTPTHLYHYVRLPVAFPTPWYGWPETVQFNVTEDELADMATEKVDTLLCPHLWETSVHG